MRISLLCKRYYTNKDLINDCFGRLFHLPVELARHGAQVTVDAIDYRNNRARMIETDRVCFRSIPALSMNIPFFPYKIYTNIHSVRPDVIIASGDSYIGFIAMLIAKKKKVPFIFDIYDYYPAFPGNKIPGMKAMFHQAVRKADLTLCSNEALRQKLLPMNRKQRVVENGVDPALFAAADRLRARQEIGLLAERPVVGYFGSIDKDRGPLLIDACRILYGEYPDLRLLLAGNVTNVGLDEPWITYYGKLPQEQLPVLINACDVVALPYAVTEQIDLAGACKIAEYLSCKKPIVATKVSVHETIFRNAPASLCDPTPHSMAEAIRRQVNQPEIVPFPVQMGWSHIGGALYDAIRKILNKGDAAAGFVPGF